MNNPLPLSLLACLCFGSLLSAAPASAQQAIPAVPASAPTLQNPYNLAQKIDGNYLTPLLILRPLRASYTASPLWHDSYFEALGEDESFIGNYAEAVADYDHAGSPPALPTATDLKAIADAEVLLKAYTTVDAREAILALASSRQAVFINEAHHVPMGRAFTLSLLRGLYAEGFRYFAAETLSEKDMLLQKRGYPTISSGYYTREPVFGDLVRTAIKLGYRIVPYEYEGAQLSDPIARQNQRERGEAQNLYDRVFKTDPNAKVLVHAGYEHIAKRSATWNLPPGAITLKAASGKVTFMALWFERISKIVPLSVDQTEMIESSIPQYEDPPYVAAIADNLLQDKPVVLKDKAGHYYADVKHPDAYDLYVFHPRTLYEFGRPMWLSMNGLRQAYVLPSDLGVPAGTSALAQAFYENEPAASAVPIDQVEVKPDLGPLPALMLPQGLFHLRVVNGAGQVLREWHIDRNGATP